MVGTMMMNQPVAVKREREKQSVTFPLCVREKKPPQADRRWVGGWLPTVQHSQMHLAMPRVFHTRYNPPPRRSPDRMTTFSRNDFAAASPRYHHISTRPSAVRTYTRKILRDDSRRQLERRRFFFVFYIRTIWLKKTTSFFRFSPINNNSFVHPSHTLARAFVQC